MKKNGSCLIPRHLLILIEKIPNAMKLTFLFLVISLLTFTAEASAQKVSISLNNVKVEKILSTITKQTGLSVAYSKQIVNLDRRMSIQVEDADVAQVLEKLVADTNLSYEIRNNKIYLFEKRSETSAPAVLQQKKQISGTVTDTKGEPIIGANVVIKGTTTGTITDIDGHFDFEVPSGAVLQVSYIGYKSSEVEVNNKTSFTISLKEDLMVLEEVVVVGFGTQKKVNLTGAVGVVEAEALEARPVMTATQALQGIVPGLQISQNNGSLESRANMNIRGTATIGKGSSGAPLILIDGMEGDINAINPQDIDNISVLKDAASSSIYGSRAPFGVILVTTKRGKRGTPVINYNNNFRWSDPVLLPKTVDSYTFATYFNDACFNEGSTPQFGQDQMQRIKDYQSGKITASVIPNPNNPSYWGDGYLYGNDNVNWYDALFRSWVLSQEHNFSLSGGSESISYYLSMNYLDQNGMMEFNQDTYNRYTGTAKINIKMTDWISLNYSSRFIREDYGRPSVLGDNTYMTIGYQGWPSLPLYDPNGYLYDSPSPALGLRDGGRGIWQTDYLYQQAQIILEPIKGWKTFVDFNYKIKNANCHWDIQKTYNHDVEGNPFLKNNSSQVHEDQTKENYTNFTAYTEYTKSIASNHDFKGMFGFQSELMKQKIIGAQRDGILVPSLTEIDLTSGTDAYGKEVTPSVNGSSNHWATAGFFGRINYGFQGKYLAEVNLRYDGTSRYRANQRWNWFPSFSVGWNILEDYVGTFKIRASYGVLGNQNMDSWYPTYQKIDIGSSNGNWLINNSRPNTAIAPELVSTALTWEKVKTWNLGLDFSAINNRLNGDLNVYKRKTLDMVGPAPELPLTLGTKVPIINNTDLETYGWELSIGWNDILKCGLGYGVKLLISDSQTEITRYPNETGSLNSDVNVAKDKAIYRTGMMLGEVWGYETIGIAKTQEEMEVHLASLPNGGQDAIGNRWGAGDIMYADLNGDGKIDNGSNTLNDHGDLAIIGNSTPRYLFGLDMNLDYKGFDFRAFFQGVLNRDYFNDSYYFWGARDNVWGSTCMPQHLDYFRNDPNHILGLNLDSYFPRPDFSSTKNHLPQTRYLQNAAYIRLKNIQLGYTLPELITRKFLVSKLRIYISGENLWTGTKMFGTFDPETVDGGWNGSVYPLSKTISLGLSLTF